MVISPSSSPAQSSRARLLSCSLAVSMMTHCGRRLCKLRRIWVLAAALRRRCLAQSIELATNSTTVLSMIEIGALKRKAGPLGLTRIKSGLCCPRELVTLQKSFSASSHGRSRFALDNPLRLGGVAPRIALSAPRCKWSESHTSLSPMLWESCASKSDTTWLQGEKLLESTPHSRANRGTKCLGIRLQTCARMVNLERVGLMYLFFMSAVWQIFNHQSNTFFSFQWDDCEK